MRDAMICFVMLTLVFHVFVDRLRHDRLVIDMKHADSRIIELQKQLNELRVERAIRQVEPRTYENEV